ncbi:transcription antitermination factor NusB [Corynebacterium marquesiae]|uniref:RsmB/NOP family class I SAM-dependent RNA methyltransferase n=1 Tax=Corynebacterium marquesiae TaxID=2913503 RepID=UPI00254C47EB|nr:transcription antitermination factor NusB [Corynebacterium marquesiae]MDK8454217.1 transcription antitermination factor NusB [Corynebacterium marquesiae]MDK8724334.1 transcription antitermination factor NusB [Corynebacterium marquesiae]MDK8769654.1 transcription antitermination factor NusB [Corynebacterium marquesiae]
MSGGFRSRSKSGDKSPAGKPQNSHKSTGAKSRGGRPQRQQRGSRGGQHRGRQAAAKGQRPGKRQENGLIQAVLAAGVDAPRAVAFDVVRRVSEDDAFANLILPKALRKQKLKGRDAAFATEITYGTLRTLGVGDAVIAECSSRGLEDISPAVVDALRLGTYQVLYTRVEPHAAVDTTVRLVEASGEVKAKGFANGIMRTITRTPAKVWLDKLAPQGEIAGIAFKHAHPTWIAESFSRVLGLGELEAALAADSDRPSVHLVARPGEISAEELALMTGNEEGRYSPYAVYMESGDPGQLEPVRQGLAAVQDEGSQLIARAVCEATLEGEDTGRWLDLCAGPGGKAALMGALARIDSAHVDAVEVSPHRAALIEKTVSDLPVDVHVADGRNPGVGEGFDRVLVDAPCSGLGALRRRPEARWRKAESDITELNQLQFELLSSALNLVRPGGVVIYSTCSPDLRETRGIVDRAVRELGAEELDAHALIPDMGDVGHEKSVQMWPHRHGTDAMFFAALRRAAN